MKIGESILSKKLSYLGKLEIIGGEDLQSLSFLLAGICAVSFGVLEKKFSLSRRLRMHLSDDTVSEG